MNATDYAAWWGAAIATLVLVWDFAKWKMSGASLNVSVAPSMTSYGGVKGHEENETYVVVEVSNVGDRKTTITHLFGTHYKSYLHKLFNKKNVNFVVANPAFTQPLPYVLEPGERWMGGIIQNQEIEKMSREGILYCGVYHSSSKRAVTQKVVINEVQST